MMALWMKRRILLSLGVIVMLLVIGASAWQAQAGGTGFLWLHGGYSSAQATPLIGEGYRLEAVAGLPAVGASSGEDYEIIGGMIPPPPQAKKIYLPMVRKW
jgi:hypothetical protein